jgi:hypothetical protein
MAPRSVNACFTGHHYLFLVAAREASVRAGLIGAAVGETGCAANPSSLYYVRAVSEELSSRTTLEAAAQRSGGSRKQAPGMLHRRITHILGDLIRFRVYF